VNDERSTQRAGTAPAGGKDEQSAHERIKPSLETLAVFVRVAEQVRANPAPDQADTPRPQQASRFKNEKELADSLKGFRSRQHINHCLNELDTKYGHLIGTNSQSNTLQLTPKGRELLLWANHLLAFHKLGPEKSPQRIRFAVATSNRSLVYILPRIVASYLKSRAGRCRHDVSFQELDLQFVEFDDIDEMVPALKSRVVDAVVGALPYGYTKTEGVDTEVFLNNVQTTLIIPIDYRKRKHFSPQVIQPGAIANETICVIQADRTGLLKPVLENLPSRSIVSVRHYSSVVALCGAGVGVGFVPVLTGEKDLHGLVLTRMIAGLDIPARQVALWTRTNDTLADEPVAQEIAAFREAIHDIYAQTKTK
jgi:DNA-binding transcriptional LysR family regulator